MEFSKKLVLILIGFCLVCVIADYTLKFIVVFHDADLENIGDSVTNNLILTILGSYMTYVSYQYGLKRDRNNHGLDADGKPYA